MITEAISMSNELDLLEAHLEESQHWADRIVIIESPVMFTGIEKPMYFAENRERFARFNVDYLVTPPDVFEKIPVSFPEEDRRKWFQARRNNRNLNRQHHWGKLCKDTDYVYVNDVDEFVSAEKGLELRDFLSDRRYHYFSINVQKFNFFVNCKGGVQEQSRIARSDMESFVPYKGTPRTNCEALGGSIGWHFTNCMSPKELQDKYYGLYLHLGMNREDIPSIEEIEDRLSRMIEPIVGNIITPVELMSKTDLSWAPKFMQDNIELFPWKEVLCTTL